MEFRSSVFVTMVQALNAVRPSPAGPYVDRYSELFSAIVAKALKDGLISEYIFSFIKYVPYQIEVNKEDFNLFKLKKSDLTLYSQQDAALTSVLSRWRKSKSITNNDQMDIFSALAMECQNLGMNENDEVMLGLLYAVSFFYTQMLKDSQADRRNCEKWRTFGTHLATELPNRWLIEKSK